MSDGSKKPALRVVTSAINPDRVDLTTDSDMRAVMYAEPWEDEDDDHTGRSIGITHPATVTADDLIGPVTLTERQVEAMTAILRANEPGVHYLLTGYAGSGKTTLMQYVARALLRRGHKVVLSAYTHKAVSVLRRKMQQIGLSDELACTTLHSLLSLRPARRGDSKVFVRSPDPARINASVVIVDECSMIDRNLMQHIRQCLGKCFVIFLGDPAQVPPINEEASESFSVPVEYHTHLTEIIRQAKGNPIIEAAHIIRQSQGRQVDWSWATHRRVGDKGVFIPSGDVDEWLKRAFLSDAFNADPDTFRYLCYTNKEVETVNNKVRKWVYGPQVDKPFMPGERGLLRNALIIEGEVIFSNNDEVIVEDIVAAGIAFEIKKTKHKTPGWTAELPTWKLTIRRDDVVVNDIHMPRDLNRYGAIVDKIRNEAYRDRDRWDDYHDLRDSLLDMQAIYALTIHKSQGSTFRNAFVDLRGVRYAMQRHPEKLQEMQQLLYVACTRPTTALVLIGA